MFEAALELRDDLQSARWQRFPDQRRAIGAAAGFAMWCHRRGYRLSKNDGGNFTVFTRDGQAVGRIQVRRIF